MNAISDNSLQSTSSELSPQSSTKLQVSSGAAHLKLPHLKCFGGKQGQCSGGKKQWHEFEETKLTLK